MAVIGAPACGSPEAKRRDEPRLVGEVRKARICEANATHIIKKDKRFFLGTVVFFCRPKRKVFQFFLILEFYKGSLYN